MKILTVTGLEYTYPDKKQVINNLSFNIGSGEKVALIGPNGSGKTTLFLLLCGIYKPKQGRMYIKQKPIQYRKFNQEIAYLFQTPDDQLFSPTVFDDIAFGPLNQGLTATEIEKQVKKALDLVKLKELKQKSPHHLSGGEKRLVALATLFAMELDLFLLDEPASNLDAGNRRNLINIITSINKTMIIASHDLEFLLEVCERCIIIDRGRFIADGEIKTILSDEKLLQAHHFEKPHSLVYHAEKHLNQIIGQTKAH